MQIIKSVALGVLGLLVIGVAGTTEAASPAPAAAAPAATATAATPADRLLADAGLPGGLLVHLGCGDGTLTAALRGNGQFLVHGLDADPARVEQARKFIDSRGLYGLVWVETFAGPRLPYAENLVNVLVIDATAAATAPLADVVRVLAPRGTAYVGPLAGTASASADALKQRLRQAGLAGAEIVRLGADTYVRWHKPWPAEMDEWGHPRHAADGNAASADRLVGPPRRIRWVAGPWHEASNAVSAGGRYFHSGLIARDAFNGLRLWQKPIDPAPLRLGYPSASVPGSVVPVAVGDRLYVVDAGGLQALDAATGRTVQKFADAGAVRHILVVGGTLLAAGADAVRAFDAAGGKLRWTYPDALPDTVVAGDGGVFLVEAPAGRTKDRAVVRLDLATGKPAWRRAEYPWAAKISRCSVRGGRLVCEVSTLNNDKPGNGVRVLDAADGRVLWERLYGPGQSHYMQARAIQTAGLVWILNGPKWEGLDPVTGSVTYQHGGGTGHCFPPVGTPRYLLSGEMNFTDIQGGVVDANHITKGACGRDAGFVPANGLVYLSPKHCSCYPMLNGYAALAPASTEPPLPEAAAPVAEKGPAISGQPSLAVTLSRAEGPSEGSRRADGPTATATARPFAGPSGAAQGDNQGALPDDSQNDWPCYRGDAWRSAATAADVPAELAVRWTATLGDWPEGPLVADWKDDLYVRGPVTPPVIAGGLVIVAQPDRHRVAALDARTGQPRWTFVANGRIDSAPTVWRDRCLFGTRSGWVYALRLADGQLAWRLRVAPTEDRIVSFGQLESPWPVPGSVLVLGDTAYVAGGRQPLADGGLRVLALDPADGTVRWQTRIDTLPYKNYYGGTGLEFDGFDLLVAESAKPQADAADKPLAPAALPDFVTLSRWRMDPRTGAAEVVQESGFGYYRAGTGGVIAPRSSWTYGPRMDYTSSGPNPGKPDFVRVKPRPLVAFRDSMVISSSDDKQQLFRRDFTPAGAAAFNDAWYNQRTVPRGASTKPGDRSRSQRLAAGAAWTVEAFEGGVEGQGVAALVLAGKTVFAAGKQGGLCIYAAADGRRLGRCDLPPPVWDGMAAAGGMLYVSTADGRVMCLGGK